MGKERSIVFIGDSITDAGRVQDPDGYGNGYVRLIRDYLVINHPNNYPLIINKGIGGHRIIDLAARWESDVIALKPDYVSISIGINDVWRQLDHPEMEQVYPNRFKQVYQDILSQVKERVDAKIILMEPTVIDENPESIGNQKLSAYVEIVRELTESFDAILVPTHRQFIDYLNKDNPVKLTTDGVHMNSTGNLLMAQTWLEAVWEYLE